MKFKKLMAVLTAGVMLLMPITANATTFTGGTATGGTGDVPGEGTLEFDNSVPPSYCNIVLPTMNVKTYEFTMDPQKILSNYDGDFSGEHSLYFLAESEPIAVSAKSGTLNTLEYQPANITDFIGSIALSSNGTATIPTADDYYLWVPQAESTREYVGAGEFRQVTTTNLAQYFAAPKNTTALAFKDPAGVSVTDKKVYTAVYTPITTGFGDYISVAESMGPNNTITVSDLYVMSNSIATEINNKTLALANLNITSPISAFMGDSDWAKIENKATTNTLVTVKGYLSNIADLKLSADPTFATTNSTNMLYLNLTGTLTETSQGSSLQNSNNTSMVFAIGNTATGVASSTIAFNLEGASMSQTIHYIGLDSDTHDKGGRNFYQYEAPEIVYDTAAFQLAGLTNYGPNGEVKPLWLKFLNNGQGMPEIKVVYTIENVLKESEATSDVTFAWEGTAGVGSFTLTVTDADPTYRIGGNAASHAITGYNTTNATAGNGVNMTATGASVVSTGTGNKAATFTLPTGWVNAGWNRLVFTGAAVSNKIITLEKAGGDTSRGAVTVTVTEP